MRCRWRSSWSPAGLIRRSPPGCERACRQQLADFKVPHQVCLVRALPRSTISKVNKSELRAFLASGDPLEHGERR